MKKSEPVRVCLYVRCGTKHGATCDCVGSQISRGWFWCASQGFNLVDIVVEDGVGPEAFNRPRFNHMLMRAKGQPAPYDIILVENSGRFSRCISRLRYSATMLSRADVRLATVTGKFPDCAEGEFWK